MFNGRIQQKTLFCDSCLRSLRARTHFHSRQVRSASACIVALQKNRRSMEFSTVYGNVQLPRPSVNSLATTSDFNLGISVIHSECEFNKE